MRAMSESAHKGVSLSVSLVLYASDLRLVARTLDHLEVALERAFAAGTLQAATLQVIDNHSPGDYPVRARELVENRRGRVSRVHLEFREAARNRGYGAGHNLALSVVDSDVHLVLNPDVELAPDALVIGIAYLQSAPETVLLAPAAAGSGGETQYLCKRYPSVLVLLLRAVGGRWLQKRFRRRLEDYELRELEGAASPVEVPLVSGCCMLARGGDLAAVGGFDEGYFLYFEDFDLSLRLAGRGRVRFHPAMRIVHHGGYAARKGWRHIGLFLRGGLRFFRQHGWRWV